MRLFFTTLLASAALSASASALPLPPVIPVIPIIVVVPPPILPMITPRIPVASARELPSRYVVTIHGTDLVAYGVEKPNKQQRRSIQRIYRNCMNEIGIMRPVPIDAGEVLDMCVRIDFRFAQQMRELPRDMLMVKDSDTLSPIVVTQPIQEPPCCVVPTSALASKK